MVSWSFEAPVLPSATAVIKILYWLIFVHLVKMLIYLPYIQKERDSYASKPKAIGPHKNTAMYIWGVYDIMGPHHTHICGVYMSSESCHGPPSHTYMWSMYEECMMSWSLTTQIYVEYIWRVYDVMGPHHIHLCGVYMRSVWCHGPSPHTSMWSIYEDCMMSWGLTTHNSLSLYEQYYRMV